MARNLVDIVNETGSTLVNNEEYEMIYDSADDEFTIHEPKKKPKRTRHYRQGRNDPCDCGSGIKYKKCCLIIGGTCVT